MIASVRIVVNMLKQLFKVGFYFMNRSLGFLGISEQNIYNIGKIYFMRLYVHVSSKNNNHST